MQPLAFKEQNPVVCACSLLFAVSMNIRDHNDFGLNECIFTDLNMFIHEQMFAANTFELHTIQPDDDSWDEWD